MTDFSDLESELRLWHDAGEQPTFWWRDDDTQGPTDLLRILADMTAKHDIPLHLAVIPEGIDPELKPFLETFGHIYAMQHGLRHKNQEPKGARASEMGEMRPLDETQTDLREGWALLNKAELPNLLAVNVPPWGRIGAKVVPHLAGWDYHALSCFGARPERESAEGLLHMNCHIEPLRWRPDAVFAGETKTLSQCVEHLRARRTGAAEKSEPTGLVTHHLQTPTEVWEFCDELAQRLTHGNRARWVALESELGPL